MLVDKYRPKSLDGVIGQEEIVNSLRRFIEKGSMPHVLFHGSPGTGKTSTAYALAHDLGVEIVEFNASDERGIDTVRNKIKEISNSFVIDGGFRILLLDEVDNMTRDAMEALRRIMETSESTKFILTANNAFKITPAIKSRCATYEFKKLSDTNVLKVLIKVIKEEGMKFTDPESLKKALLYLSKKSDGDLRYAITNGIEATLESDKDLSLLELKMDMEKPDEALMILKTAIRDSDLVNAKNQLYGYASGRRIDPSTIINEFGNALFELDFDDEIKRIKLIEKLGETERGVKMGCDPITQMISFLASCWIINHITKECQFSWGV